MQRASGDGHETLCLVVPCYNEEESLPAFFERMDQLYGESGLITSYVFVNDGSSDDTLAFIRQRQATDDSVHYISFSKNFGKEAALLAGMSRALELGTDFVGLIDVDL